METTAFDPDAPLPGPPDPWAATDMPSLRPGPPYHMTEMIAAEPALVERILARHADPRGSAASLAEAVLAAVRDGARVVTTGCGTSEHAAQAVAAILGEATGSTAVTSVQAFELSLDPPSDGLVIGISHEGGTAATNAALSAARAAGAGTAIVTVSGGSPGASLAGIVVETGELDQSWCHTVGYLSPIVAAAAVAGHITGRPLGPDAAGTARALLESVEDEGGVDRMAGRVASATRLLVLASGADRPAGRELVLKVEEGAWIPAAYRDLETFLHGHLAATDETTALVLILTDRAGRAERSARARAALAAARGVGIDAGAILAASLDDALPAELTPAGRLVVAESPDLPPTVAALLGSAVPLQLLAERTARARGVNPDPIHRDVDRYREAAEAAEA